MASTVYQDVQLVQPRCYHCDYPATGGVKHGVPLCDTHCLAGDAVDTSSNGQAPAPVVQRSDWERDEVTSVMPVSRGDSARLAKLERVADAAEAYVEASDANGEALEAIGELVAALDTLRGDA